VAYSGSENWIVSYSLTRGLVKETGQLYVTTDGSTVAVTTTNAYLGSAGVSFDGTISGSNLLLRYTTTSTGTAAVMKTHTVRWSDAVGGLAEIPSYSGVGRWPTPASGVSSDIQSKGGDGNLAGDTSFKWDSTNDAIMMDGLSIKALQGPFTLLDNQASPVTIVTYSASTKYTILEYSLSRNGEDEVGSVMVVSNGTAVSYSGSTVNTVDLGVLLSATISAGTISIKYTSTNTGFTSSFKYSTRSWS